MSASNPSRPAPAALEGEPAATTEPAITRPAITEPATAEAPAVEPVDGAPAASAANGNPVAETVTAKAAGADEPGISAPAEGEPPAPADASASTESAAAPSANASGVQAQKAEAATAAGAGSGDGSPGGAGGVAAGPRRPSRSGLALLFLEKYGLLVLFVLVFVFFAQFWDYPATFRDGDNIRQVLRSQAIPAILALATIIPLICGHFDLTTGSVAGLTAMTVAAAVTDKSQNVWLGIVVALVFALAVGLVNGLLVAYVGINSFITTLGIGISVNGLISWYSSGSSVLIDSTSGLSHLASRDLLGIPRLAWIVAGLGLLVYYLLAHTPVGRYLHSIGSNATAARLVGLNVPRLVLLSFLLSALLSGIAGVLYLGNTGSAQVQGTGMSLTLPALAAAFLGATAIRPGRFNVAGTLLAVYFIAFTLSGLNLNGVDTWVQDLFTGAALVLAIALSTLIARHRARATA